MTLPDPALQPEFYTDVPLKRAGAWAIDLVVTLALTLVGLVLTLFISAFFLPLLFCRRLDRLSHDSCWRATAQPWA